MPDRQSDSQANSFGSGLADTVVGNAHHDELRIARRMRQLASEIRYALDRNDLNLARHASGLLTPTLAQWQAEHSPLVAAPTEIVELARQAQLLLDECSEDLAKRMTRVAMELQRLRKSQKAIAGFRRRRPPASLHRLDIRY